MYYFQYIHIYIYIHVYICIYSTHITLLYYLSITKYSNLICYLYITFTLYNYTF